MKRIFILAFIFASASWAACTIAVTAPAASEVIGTATATTGSVTQYTLKATPTTCPTLFSMEWRIDGYDWVGVTKTAPYSLIWDPYLQGNGSQHTVQAIGWDLDHVTSWLSPVNTFSIEEPLPQLTNPQTDVTFTLKETASFWMASFGNTHISVIGFTPSGGSPPTISHKGLNSACGSPCTLSITAASGNGLGIAVYVSSNSATLSATTAPGSNTIICSTPAAASDGFYVAWCGSSSLTNSITSAIITASGNPTINAAQGFEILGQAALDNIVATTNASLGGGAERAILSGAFTPTANELYLAVAGWNAAPGASGITQGGGWTLQQEDTPYAVMATESAVFPANTYSGWLALGMTVNGANSAITKDFNWQVEGIPPLYGCSSQANGCVTSDPGDTTASYTAYIDTSKFLNGPRVLKADVVSATGLNTGMISAPWGTMGEFTQALDFENGTYPMELRADSRDYPLCLSGTTDAICTATKVVKLSMAYTDGTTAPIPACSGTLITGWYDTTLTITSSLTANATVSACSVVAGQAQVTVTPVALGSSEISFEMTPSRVTRNTWAYVQPNSSFYHFGSNGQPLTAYASGNSHFWEDSFASGPCATGTTQVTIGEPPAKCAPAYKAAYNATEIALQAPPSVGTSEATFDAATNTTVTNTCNALNTYGLKGFILGDSNVVQGSPGIFAKAISGPGASYATPALQFNWQAYKNAGCAIASSWCDECSTSYGPSPIVGHLTGGVKLGTNGVTNIVISGTTATVNISAFCTGADTTQNCFAMNNSGAFILRCPTLGDTSCVPSGQASIIYNPMSPSVHAVTIGSSTITFTTSASAVTLTAANSCMAAGGGCLTIEPYAAYVYDANFTDCLTGGGTPPCNNFVTYDGFTKIFGWTAAVSGGPALAWTPVAFTNLKAWTNPSVASGAEIYWSEGVLYPGDAQSALIGGQGDQLRRAYSYVQQTSPIISVASGILTNENFAGGGGVAITSCVGGQINTTTPHGITNLLPGLSRLWVSGSSGAGCDGNYYVTGTPNASAISVASMATPQVAVTSGITATFDDGNVLTGMCMSGSTPVSSLLLDVIFHPSNCGSYVGDCMVNVKAERGHNFTTNSGLYPGTFWLMPPPFTLDDCTPGGSNDSVFNYAAQVPNLSSTGGTAYIVPDGTYLLGRNSGSYTGVPRRPSVVFANALYPLILKTAAIRIYGGGITYATGLGDRTLTDPALGTIGWNFGAWTYAVPAYMGTHTTDGSQMALQCAINPLDDSCSSQAGFQGMTSATQMLRWEEPAFLQPRLPSPDFGYFVETMAAQAPDGSKAIAVQSFLLSPQSITVPLGAYNAAGGWKLCATSSTVEALVSISSVTTSDTFTIKPGEHCAYKFPLMANLASAVSQPSPVTLKLADVSGATGLAIRYGYTPYAFDPNQVTALPNVVDCAATFPCAIPADKNAASVGLFGQYVFYNSTGVVQSSSVQPLN